MNVLDSNEPLKVSISEQYTLAVYICTVAFSLRIANLFYVLSYKWISLTKISKPVSKETFA